jgi:hypothetical protein
MTEMMWNGSDGQTPRGRVGVFLCECGCGQEFFRSYKTRHPRYANKTHRARAYRARARAMVWAIDTSHLEGYDEIYIVDLYHHALRIEQEKLRGRM